MSGQDEGERKALEELAAELALSDSEKYVARGVDYSKVGVPFCGGYHTNHRQPPAALRRPVSLWNPPDEDDAAPTEAKDPA